LGLPQHTSPRRLWAAGVQRAPGEISPALAQFKYFDADRATDASGFPALKTTLTNANLTGGVTVAMPAHGVVVLTTAP